MCVTCDGSLGIWDEYGVHVLLKELDQFETPAGLPVLPALIRASYDYGKLKLFLLSVLWRANESRLPAFGKVRLGPHADRLRELIRNKDPGAPDEFSTVLSMFTVAGEIPTEGVGILDPQPERWDGVNDYRLSFGLVTAYVKVDQRRFDPSFSRLALNPGEPLFLLKRDYATSEERRLTVKIARSPQNQRAFPQDRWS